MREREKDWTKYEIEKTIGDADRFLNLEEANLFRISPGDFSTRAELIKHLQRKQLFEESYQHILEAKKDAETKGLRISELQNNLPSIFFKYEGLALLKLGREEDAIECFKRYRTLLTEQIVEPQTNLDLSLNQSSQNTAVEQIDQDNILSEIASIAFKEKNFPVGN
jgi:hypothetical protein